jgi:hypothetical protein
MAKIITRVEPATINQALEAHLRDLEVRKRKPAKPSTLATFRSYQKWIARVGDIAIADFNNASMRDFVEYLSARPNPQSKSRDTRESK